MMPLAAPIGSGLGIENPANLRIMREQLPDAIIIGDAGVDTCLPGGSHAKASLCQRVQPAHRRGSQGTS
ncbi:MAG TPA: hypothetical protein VGJ55_12530 [Pyrinomonadaceae bacterium]